MNNYEVTNGVIKSKRGIPCAPRWICDGRLAFSYDENGVGFMEYYAGREHDGNAIMFMKGLFHSFKLLLMSDGVSYHPDYSDVEIYPYSIESEWKYNDDILKFGLYALDESMVFCISTPENLKSRLKLSLSFYESTQLIPAETGDFLHSGRGMNRTWKDWNYSENALIGGYKETGVNAEDIETDVFMRLASNISIEIKRTKINSRVSLISEYLKPDGQYVFALTPDTDKNRCMLRNKNIVSNFSSVLSQQRDRYFAVQQKSPVLECNRPILSQFFQLAPLYHESLKAVDTLGALRAKTTRYWVWGWDAMISNNAPIYWGDGDHIEKMLGFIEKTSNDEKGIAHAYTNANTPASYMAEPAQGMYICLLFHYYSLTGDTEAVKRFYPFAKSVMKRMMKTKIDDIGLFKGTSLYPDFPELLKETGNDISLYNNALAYSSLRAMESLACIVKDDETEKELREFLLKTRQHFSNIFFEPELGTYVNSADASTLFRRNSVCVTSLIWENDFLEELIYKEDNECISFIEKHCLSKAYLRAVPLWDEAYDGDANQLHCTWPVVDESFVRLANRTGKADLLNIWASWVEYWTKHLLCPEGISYLIETDTPALDNWNCESGTWQAYSMRRWYQDVLHGYLGIVFDSGGITFTPSGTGCYKISNLHYKDKIVFVECIGEGRYIEYIEINGNKLTGTNKVPYTVMEKSSNEVYIIAKLCTEPVFPITLLSCYGAGMSEWEHSQEHIWVSLSGAGTCLIKLNAKVPCNVMVNGGDVPYERDCKTGTLRLTVVLRTDEITYLEVRTRDANRFVE